MNSLTLAERKKYASFIEKFNAIISSAISFDELYWSVVKGIENELKFNDCVIYIYNPKRKALIQKASIGKKLDQEKKIKQILRIEPGEGIVGRVFETALPRITNDTSKNPNYIIDDQFRLSEITIPILSGDKVLGVIDSEHPSEFYYTKDHAAKLKIVANLMGEKISALNLKPNK